MNDYCPDCGAKFEEPRDLSSHWLRLLKCPRCSGGDFLEVIDSRWIFPLLRLDPGTLTKIKGAEAKALEIAAARVRRVDFKTVSIVGFEQTLLGCFDQSRSYRIVYPDGSEK